MEQLILTVAQVEPIPYALMHGIFLAHTACDLRRFAWQKGKVNISYIPTNKMVADGLTKPLGKDAFKKFVEMLGMVEKEIWRGYLI